MTKTCNWTMHAPALSPWCICLYRFAASSWALRLGTQNASVAGKLKQHADRKLWVAEEGSRESVDAKCRRLTAAWVREKASSDPEVELCSFNEGLDAAGPEAVLDPGVYTLNDMRNWGRKKGWCPYFLARHMLAFANVIVYNYQYMLDPKVSRLILEHAARHFLSACHDHGQHHASVRVQPYFPHILADLPAISCMPGHDQGSLSKAVTVAQGW